MYCKKKINFGLSALNKKLEYKYDPESKVDDFITSFINQELLIF